MLKFIPNFYERENLQHHDVATQYKGNYRMDFKDKSGKTLNCKMSCIPVVRPQGELLSKKGKITADKPV